MSTSIPDRQRRAVRVREKYRCARCGISAPNGEWHHRRTRSVVDEHQHCTCCGILLCSSCHRYVHANPLESRRNGWIVSRYVAEPGTVPVVTAWGIRFHDCDGKFTYQEEQPDVDEDEDEEGPS